MPTAQRVEHVAARTVPARTLDMHCRVSGCRKRSSGPRFRFMCPEHQKLGIKAQAAAVVAYATKRRRS